MDSNFSDKIENLTSCRLTCLVSITYPDVLTTLPSAFDVPVSNWKCKDTHNQNIVPVQVYKDMVHSKKQNKHYTNILTRQ